MVCPSRGNVDVFSRYSYEYCKGERHVKNSAALPANIVGLKFTMPVEITALTEADIPGAIDTIQQAFADDPYNRWVFNDRSKVRLCFLSHAHPHSDPFL